MDTIPKLLNNLKALGESPSTLPDRVKTLEQLKRNLTFLNTLPPSTHQPDPKECILAREVYEYACFMSIEAEDVNEFERNF